MLQCEIRFRAVLRCLCCDDNMPCCLAGFIIILAPATTTIIASISSAGAIAAMCRLPFPSTLQGEGQEEGEHTAGNLCQRPPP